MTRIRFAAAFLLASIGLAASSLTHAQATRTWVSGVGDDANPCSRTAPCKTFAGAISKTATGGEISVLDPGGYGAVTITKSITIDGGTGAGWGSILNSGVNGIIVSNIAPTNAVVILRNLSINGAGTTPGTNGIRIMGGGKVYVESSVIFGQGGRGIIDERTTGGQLFVTDSVIRNNTSSGIVVSPASGNTTIDVSIRNVQLTGNAGGVTGNLGAHITIANSVISGNTSQGVFLSQAAGNTQVNISNSTISDNAIGIVLSTGTPTLVLDNVLVTDNNSGMTRGTGTVLSAGNNRFIGNVADNGPFSPGFTVVPPL